MVENFPAPRALRFRELPGTFAVCRVAPDFKLSDRQKAFFSFTSSYDETSLVCAEEQAPAEGKIEKGWICFQLQGPFPFTMTGVLASFLWPLAAASIPIFAVSTYDTDYILIKGESREKAVSALVAAGHELIS
jgi:uncharacterized protein